MNISRTIRTDVYYVVYNIRDGLPAGTFDSMADLARFYGVNRSVITMAIKRQSVFQGKFRIYALPYAPDI